MTPSSLEETNTNVEVRSVKKSERGVCYLSPENLLPGHLDGHKD
jgi:hypothetical protein